MNTTSITIRPTSAHYYTLECMDNLTTISAVLRQEDALPKLLSIIEREQYNIDAVLVASAILSRQGDVQKACEMRFRASSLIMDVLPDDEDVILEWDAELYNRQAVELIFNSAMDHYAFGDYEYAAGMLEMALMLDEEDHFGATLPLAFCYIALQEWELLDEALMDIADPSMERDLLTAWSDFRRDAISADKLRARLAKESPELLAEFTRPDHTTTDELMVEMDSDRQSKRAKAHALWLQTEGLWQSFPEFTSALTL